MKNERISEYLFGGFLCCVLSRDELESRAVVLMEDVKVREYAVFACPVGMRTYVQVSRWFHYRGAAINKMCRMYGI